MKGDERWREKRDRERERSVGIDSGELYIRERSCTSPSRARGLHFSSYARTAHGRVVIIDARVRRVLDACVSRDQNRKCPFANKVKFLEIPSLDEPRNAKSRPIDFVRADKALRRLYAFCCLGRREAEGERSRDGEKERKRKEKCGLLYRGVSGDDETSLRATWRLPGPRTSRAPDSPSFSLLLSPSVASFLALPFSLYARHFFIHNH